MSRVEEIWLPIPSFAGWHASSWGRVCQEPYEYRMPNGGSYMREVPPTFGTPNKGKQGRLQISVFGQNRWIAPLICEAFHGLRPTPKHECLHLDESNDNNRSNNLAWGTRKENMSAPGFVLGCKIRMKATDRLRGENHPLAKLTASQVTSIRASASSHSTLANRFGVSRSLITLIKSRQGWSHI